MKIKPCTLRICKPTQVVFSSLCCRHLGEGGGGGLHLWHRMLYVTFLFKSHTLSHIRSCPFESLNKSVTILIKATEQCFPVALFILLIPTNESVNGISKCDHSNESY